jgi:hypothetical protein
MVVQIDPDRSSVFFFFPSQYVSAGLGTSSEGISYPQVEMPAKQEDEYSGLTVGELAGLIHPYNPGNASQRRETLVAYIRTLPPSVHEHLQSVISERRSNKEAQKPFQLNRRAKRKIQTQFKRRVAQRIENDEKADPTHDTDRFLELPSQEEVRDMLHAFVKSTGDASIARATCIVCAQEKWKKDGTFRRLSSIPDPTVLFPTTAHPVSDAETTDGMLLHHPGIHPIPDARTDPGDGLPRGGHICDTCWKHIQDRRKPPISLANDMWIGDPPTELADLSVAEQMLIARAHPRTLIFKMLPRSGKRGSAATLQRGMRGHVTSYETDLDSIAHLVEGDIMPRPLAILPSLVAVCFIGRGKLPQHWLRQMFIVRRDHIRKALVWLKANNKYYHHITIPEARIQSLPEADVPEEVMLGCFNSDQSDMAEQEEANYVPKQPDHDGVHGESIMFAANEY